MLLAQVCSLHDATPRTFVVHVIALYERGILDRDSIRFLFDLGLVPAGGSCGGLGLGHAAAAGAEEDGRMDRCDGDFSPPTDDGNRPATIERSDAGGEFRVAIERGAIVPYRGGGASRAPTPDPTLPESEAGPSRPPPSATGSGSSSSSSSGSSSSSSSSGGGDGDGSPPPGGAASPTGEMMVQQRRREASAIREHLERHESIDLETSSSLSSAPRGRATTTTTTGVAASNVDEWSSAGRMHGAPPASSSTAEESFDNPPAGVVSAYPPPPPSGASWSVEHHPLSLSRYQREFHQSSLLATGSFGSGYHALHKLEGRPYAVKRVTFSTVGYYASALALVMREVRVLAKLDHPNCVRYYTSWLEPSWMTGDNSGGGGEEGGGTVAPIERDVRGGYHAAHRRRRDVVDDIDGGGGGPKLLTDIERVVDGLHDAGEIDDSVEQLEAILYGGRGGDGDDNDDNDDNDDGFDWTTSSSPLKNDHLSSVQPSFDRSERKDAAYDDDGWDGLPSHRTNGRHYPMNPRGNKSGDGSDSEASAWTQDYNGDDGSSSGGRDSFHNSEAYAKRGSLELVSTGGNDRPPRRLFGKISPPPPLVGDLQVSNFSLHPDAAMPFHDFGGLHKPSQRQLRRFRRGRETGEVASRDRNIRPDRFGIVARAVSFFCSSLLPRII